MTGNEKSVLYEVSEAIALITVNRPKVLNALDPDTIRALRGALHEAEGDEAVRAIILTGAGEKAFVAGADIRQFPSMSPEAARRSSSLGMDLTFFIERLPKPVLAAVNGFALGGGCELALACDLIYASENARFGQPEVKLGIIPGFGGTQRLARRVGRARAFQLITSGEMITADEAFRMGLVNAVFPREELLPQTRALAAQLSRLAPLAIAQAKCLLNEGIDLPLRAACEMERQAFAGLFGSEDQREGAEAFLEKRKPTFKGR